MSDRRAIFSFIKDPTKILTVTVKITVFPLVLILLSRDLILIHAGSTFPDLNSMMKALQNGSISSVLLEMYVPLKRKDLFNGSWFDVKDFLEAEISHGVLLEGKSVSKLANEMKNLIVKNNIQTEYLLQDDDVMEQYEVRLLRCNFSLQV